MNASDLVRLQAVRRMAANGTARRLRLTAGVRLTEVAAVCGVTPATPLRWEKGVRMVPSSRAGLRYCRLVQRWAADDGEAILATG